LARAGVIFLLRRKRKKDRIAGDGPLLAKNLLGGRDQNSMLVNAQVV
jgi:hypothetical protein